MHALAQEGSSINAVLVILLFFVLPVPKDATHSDFVIRFGRSVAFLLGTAFSALTGFAGIAVRDRRRARGRCSSVLATAHLQ